jgi:hypothetical protein
MQYVLLNNDVEPIVRRAVEAVDALALIAEARKDRAAERRRVRCAWTVSDPTSTPQAGRQTTATGST